MDLTFFVPGVPIQQGSKVPGRRKDGTSFVREQTGPKLVLWRKEISRCAAERWRGDVLDEAVWLEVTFVMPRGKTVKRPLPTVAPDLDKLVRAVGDALKGIIYKDDCLIVKTVSMKVYTDKEERPEPGALIRVRSVS